jgi:hypothetical protein
MDTSAGWRRTLWAEAGDHQSHVFLLPRDIVAMTNRWLKQRRTVVAARSNGVHLLLLFEHPGLTISQLITSDKPLDIAMADDLVFGIGDLCSFYSLANIPVPDFIGTGRRNCTFRGLSTVVGAYSTAHFLDGGSLLYKFAARKLHHVETQFPGYGIWDVREHHGEELWLISALDYHQRWGPKECLRSISADLALLCKINDEVHCVDFHDDHYLIHDRRSRSPVRLSLSSPSGAAKGEIGRDEDHLWRFGNTVLWQFDWRAASWGKHLEIPYGPWLSGHAAEFWA